MGSSGSNAKETNNNVELVSYKYTTLNDIPYISLDDDHSDSEDNIDSLGVNRTKTMGKTDTVLTNLNPTKSLAKFFDNRHVILRCILIILSLLLGACSLLYAIGQITILQLTNYFCSPVSLTEIRQHSRDKQLAYGDYDDCWISKGIKVNNKKLYSLNAYEGKVQFGNGPLSIFTLCIFFVIACWLIFCCLYFSYLLIRDLRKYLNGYYSRSRHNAILKSNRSKMNVIRSLNCVRKMKQFGKCISSFYKKYFGPDKALWAFAVFGLEAFEIALQSIVCLGYAGVQVKLPGTTSKDKHNIAIAWQEVLIYVCIIGCNSICTGILWLLYVFKHDIFKGDTFHYIMFLVDAIFDTLYVLFPLAVVIYDGNDLKYSVGALNIETFSKFFSAFWPLLLLCIKVFTASNTMIKKNEETWYEDYSIKFIGIDGTSAANNKKGTTDLKEMKEMYNPDQFWKVFTSGQKLIDANNNTATPKLLSEQSVLNPIDAQLYLNYRRQQYFRKSCLVCMGLLYFLFGIIIMILSTYFFYSAIDQCENPSYEILQNHLELLTWPYCSYKVYPFTGLDTMNEIPCQCKTLLISESDYIDIGINESIVNDIFSQFYSLQNIKLSSPRLQETNIRFTNEMMVQRSIRSVSINGFHIMSIDEMGILNWNSIEYLEFNLTRLDKMPNTTGQLKNIKYLNLAWNAIKSIDWICNFPEIKYLNINGNPIPNTPECIWRDLKQLNTLHFATVNGFFDYRMLALPQLLSLKAIGTHIDKEAFPKNISFIYNISTSVELQANVLCDHYYRHPFTISNYSHRVWQFLNDTNACHKYCRYNEEALYAHCQFSEWQNGVCDVGCNNLYCGYDGGDCNQQCDTSVCNQTLWINNKCDKQCDTDECSDDFGDCLSANDSKIYQGCFEFTDCKEEYINDISDQTSWCDNDCNNAYCDYDHGDCKDCSQDKDCFQYWQYFTYISNLFSPDFLIEFDELCNIWDFYIAGYGDDVDYNCTTLIQSFDVDGNLKLNAYETSRIFFDEDDDRPDQINCSICAINVESYYAPWTFQNIPYWVNVTKHKKHGNFLKNESQYLHEGVLS